VTLHAARRAPLAVAGIALAVTLVACAARPIRLPSGAGTPIADPGPIVDQALAGCRGVRTLQAELSISGRAGGEKLGGRVIAGFERPRSMRLEGVAPFGPPAFILVARDGLATLLMPRDGRLLQDAAPAAVIEALAGVPVTAAGLRAVLSGCLADDPVPANARAFPGGWAVVELDDETTAYLRQDGDAWRVVAGMIGRLSVEYGRGAGAIPVSTRLRVVDEQGTVVSDLRVTVSQVETNVAIDPGAFSITRPVAVVPMTLDELRRAGPLGPRR